MSNQSRVEQHATMQRGTRAARFVAFLFRSPWLFFFFSFCKRKNIFDPNDERSFRKFSYGLFRQKVRAIRILQQQHKSLHRNCRFNNLIQTEFSNCSLTKNLWGCSGNSVWENRIFGDFFPRKSWYTLVCSFLTQIYSYLKSIYNFFFNEIGESCGNYVALGEASF